MKKTLITATLGVFCILFLLSADAAGVSAKGNWSTYDDKPNGGSSTIAMKEDTDGATFSGQITNKYEYGYAGWQLTPDAATLALLKTAKSFSFKTVGDGNTYEVRVCTSDIKDSAHYLKAFPTTKGAETTVTVKMSELKQPQYWGEKKKFNQNLAFQLQWQTTNNGKPGTFNVKVYDIRLIP